jgi:hypothetical protein
MTRGPARRGEGGHLARRGATEDHALAIELRRAPRAADTAVGRPITPTP